MKKHTGYISKEKRIARLFLHILLGAATFGFWWIYLLANHWFGWVDSEAAKYMTGGDNDVESRRFL